jgi:hypothetical protein
MEGCALQASQEWVMEGCALQASQEWVMEGCALQTTAQQRRGVPSKPRRSG